MKAVLKDETVYASMSREEAQILKDMLGVCQESSYIPELTKQRIWAIYNQLPVQFNERFKTFTLRTYTEP